MICAPGAGPAIKRASAAGLTALLFAFSASSATAAEFNPPKHYYLALGDSLAFGAQLGKFFEELAAGTYDPATFKTGYVDDFAARLKSIDPRLQAVNLSCPAETTASFSGTCPFRALGLSLHADYPGSQESAALTFLRDHRGQVGPITIDLGLNDALLPCTGPTFAVDVACIHTTMPRALQSVGANLPAILARLHAASPSSEVIVMTYFNPFFVEDPSTDGLIRAMDTAITAIAAAQHARVADTFLPFNSTGDETSTLCALTLMCSPAVDYHASDAGYEVMANWLWAASGFTRLGA
jgi:lysophospholipase L1-like esterase